jgi:hypothetical protein
MIFYIPIFTILNSRQEYEIVKASIAGFFLISIWLEI